MVIDVLSKFGWIEPLKDKRGESVAKAFQNIFKWGRKPRFLWTDRGSKFYNGNVKQMLSKENIKLYSTENEEKSSIVERWNKTIKNKMWQMFSAYNNTVYFDKPDELVDEYNNKKHRSIQMTPSEASGIIMRNVSFKTLYSKPQKPKLRVGDKVRISKYKRKVFDKGYTPNWTEEIFLIAEILNTTPVTYKLVDLLGEAVSGSFYQQELQRTSQDISALRR